jgi:Spy/CpxP family protein refolding chaperone
MRPEFLFWWKNSRFGGGPDAAAQETSDGGDCGPGGSCGPGARFGGWGPRHWRAGGHGDPGEFGGGSFGVRRPLRYLAYKLDLDEVQVAELAKVLDELKTERAQAAVDDRRTLTAFADAVGGDKFDDAKAAEGAALRIKSAERLRDAVLKALRGIHAQLDAEQRQKLAYLIRTGTLTL